MHRCPNGKRPIQITSGGRKRVNKLRPGGGGGGGTHVAIEYCPMGRDSLLNCVPQRRMSSPLQYGLQGRRKMV